MQTSKHTGALLAELFVLFGVVPVVLIYTGDYVPLIPTILLIFLGVLIWLRTHGWSYRDLLILGPARQWRNMLLLFGVFTLLWTAVVLVFFPESFLQFPSSEPFWYLIVMVLYPLLSAFPQEVMYRTYFFRRYAELFNGSQWGIVITSGLLFMWAHIIFMNPIALLATLLGGVIFAWRYQQTGSILLVSVEHALYGNLFFTIGLGQFIYAGAV